MNNKKFASIIFAVFILAGCSAMVGSLGVVSTETLTPSPVLSVEPVDTSTKLPAATAFPSETLVPTPVPAQLMLQACIGQSDSPAKMSAQGVLVLESFDLASLTSTGFFYSMEKRILNPLSTPGRFVYSVGVSPDRTKLLYQYDSQTASEYRLAITDSQGKVLKDFDDRILPESWWNYSAWQSANTLRAVILDLGKRRVLLRLYNFQTEEFTPLKTDWPNLYKGDTLDWGIDALAIKVSSSDGANIVYDPSITRVVYPKQGEIVSLTNVETGQELASIQLPQWGHLPRWSDDGQNLAIIGSPKLGTATGQDEFYIVSRDGAEFKRLTYLTNQFETVHISDYAWSPDGKQITFWLNTTAKDPTVEGTQSNLAILNVATGEITDLCIQGISVTMGHEVQITHIQPVWSPDGSQIMFAQLDPVKAKSFNVLIVDLKTKTAFKIASNKEPVGWMLKEP